MPDPQLVELLVKNEIARRVTQMYVLERLSRLDIATARDMLASLVPALERLSKVCQCSAKSLQTDCTSFHPPLYELPCLVSVIPAVLSDELDVQYSLDWHSEAHLMQRLCFVYVSWRSSLSRCDCATACAASTVLSASVVSH